MRRIMILFMALFAMSARCQESPMVDHVTTDADKQLACEIMDTLLKADSEAQGGLTVSQMMVMAAKSMLGTPYVAGTLDEDPDSEKLRVYLTKTDCIIFVETCLNLARTVRNAGGKAPDFDSFVSMWRLPGIVLNHLIHIVTVSITRLNGYAAKKGF